MSSIATWLLQLFGWSLVGELPANKKYVIIIAPHTSNWDFVVFILVKMVFRLKAVFIGKHTIFVGPFGWVLRKLGGIPVNRSSAHNVVDTIVYEFEKRDEMVFALSPEGTRSYLDHWKSGFYHIARKADVPVQIVYLNAGDKTLGLGPLLTMTEDKNSDLKKIAKFYADKQGIKPEKFSKIIFRTSDKE